MGAEGSVSRLIGGLVVGDEAAVQRLWERYFRRLVGLARKRLADAPRRVADEEDVAFSAFDSFCRNAEGGRCPPRKLRGNRGMVTLIQRAFVVDVPLLRAWEHLARVEQWPSWAAHIKRIDLRPPGP